MKSDQAINALAALAHEHAVSAVESLRGRLPMREALAIRPADVPGFVGAQVGGVGRARPVQGALARIRAGRRLTGRMGADAQRQNPIAESAEP